MSGDATPRRLILSNIELGLIDLVLVSQKRASPPSDRGFLGTTSASLLRRRGRGAALPPRRRPPAHLPAATQPADPRARDRAGLHAARTHPPPCRADPGGRGLF